jgi:hypothetical protein
MLIRSALALVGAGAGRPERNNWDGALEGTPTLLPSVCFCDEEDTAAPVGTASLIAAPLECSDLVRCSIRVCSVKWNRMSWFRFRGMKRFRSCV